jgi:hypothetical protein
MINHPELLMTFIHFLGFSCLVAFFYGPWQRVVVDVIRQKLFELRDAAFDQAVDGNVAFDSEQYEIFRNMINTMIRNAHVVSFWRLFIFNQFAKNNSKHIAGVLGEKISGGDDQHFLLIYYSRACKWIALMMWLRSPLLLFATVILAVLLPIIALLAILGATVRSIPRKFYSLLERQIQNEAAINMGHNTNSVCA